MIPIFQALQRWEKQEKHYNYCHRCLNQRYALKKVIKCSYNPCRFCSKGKPIGIEGSKKTIIIIVTFVCINGMRGSKISKYHYNPRHFYTLLQFLEHSLKIPLVLMAEFVLQTFLLGIGSKTQKRRALDSFHCQSCNRFLFVWIVITLWVSQKLVLRPHIFSQHIMWNRSIRG